MRNRAVEAGLGNTESLSKQRSTRHKNLLCFIVYLSLFFFTFENFSVFAQQPYSQFTPQMSTQFASNQPSSQGSYLKNSAAFRQEIMRMEINVTRGGETLPITQVPRVQKDDVIRMHLLEESTGGIKPSESYWNWTFLVAYINPNRRGVEGGKQGTVSEEIQFRKRGWYKEYSFVVPYDSQPVFFLYPKPKYRGQILKLVNKKYDEVRKLGEKTIELASAYARIDSFLNELQSVLYRTQSSYYGNFVTYPQLPATSTGSTYNPYGTTSTYNPYGTTPTSTYNPFGTTNTYNPYGTPTPTPTPQNVKQPDPVYNFNAFFEQSIERLAASFNINLPSCWQTNNGGFNYFGSPGGYGSYGSSFGSSSYGSTGSSYGTTGGIYGTAGNSPNSFGHAVSSEFVGRAQCLAKNIRIEDFDFSVSKLLQEGGIFAATQLRDKYPQLAYYINLAAVAIDFIIKVFQKYPLKIVPTIIQTSDNNGYAGGNYGSGGGSSNGSYSASYSNPYPSGNSSPSASGNAQPVKISLYAEAQPDDGGAVTAYPIVVHKWQAEPDPEIISLSPPVMVEPCLHAGTNILKSIDISQDESQDVFTRNFRLTVSADNGFKKEFPLKKNLGAGGWELNLTNEDLNSFPKIQMTLNAEITGTRGFNDIKSPKFILPLNTGSNWQIKPESQKAFSVGGRRMITLQNMIGTCRCLQAVIYKPSFGGQFVYEANAKNPGNQLQYSLDGKEVSFEIDTSNFQPGAGTLDLKTYGDNQTGQSSQMTQPTTQPTAQNGQSTTLSLKLYPLPPIVKGVKMARGDRQAIISGERLEQIQFIRINGKRATLVGNAQQSANAGFTGSGIGTNPMISPPANSTPTSANPMTGSVMPPASMGAQMPSPLSNAGQLLTATPSAALSALGSLAAGERLAVFDDLSTVLTDNNIVIEVGLEEDRIVPVQQSFPSSPSRPAVAANDNREIEGSAINAPTTPEMGNKSAADKPAANGAALNLSGLPVFPIDTREISLKLQNTLTDYDFKPENLAIETRIENSPQNNAGNMEVAKASLEVLDWKSMRVTLRIGEQGQKLLGGRRLQLRLHDRERGDSDWYTVKQTFVRLPQIDSVRCTPQMNGQCELKGRGIDYIAQISVDGGSTWYPGEGATLQAQAQMDGTGTALIPYYANKKLLLIRLRDFPGMTGAAPGDYQFSNTTKAPGSKPTTGRKPAPENVKQNPSMPQQSPPLNQSRILLPAGIPGAINSPGTVNADLPAKNKAVRPPSNEKRSLKRKSKH